MQVHENPFAVLGSDIPKSKSKNTNKNANKKKNPNANKNKNKNPNANKNKNKNPNNNRNNPYSSNKTFTIHQHPSSKSKSAIVSSNSPAPSKSSAPAPKTQIPQKKPQLNAKAARAFATANQLSNAERAQRNKEKKHKKSQKKQLEKKLTENPKALGAGGDKKILSLEEAAKLEQQIAIDRKKKVNEFLKSVGSTLNGRCLWFDVDMDEMPEGKETNEIREWMIEKKPYKSFGLLLKSRFFF